MKLNIFITILLASIATTACVNPALKQASETKKTVPKQLESKQAELKQTEPKPSNDAKSNGVKLNPTKVSDATEFLTFAEAFSNMPPDVQKQALASTNQALALNPNDLMQRMKLVMILGLPSSNLLDGPKAQSLLQTILQEDILLGTQLAYAHVLFDYLVAANKVSKNTHDDSKRVELLLQKNEALQIKLDAAQQKLDDLKKIEKSMGERESLPKEPMPKEPMPKEPGPKESSAKDANPKK
jgi:hypothetical protein